MDSRTSELSKRALEVAGLADETGRSDLARRLRAAVARVRRPETVVCVVGEFKQGKSSLINAMLCDPVCPVDDDLATSALMLVYYGETRRAQVRHVVGEEAVVDPIEPGATADWASEAGNPRNAKAVERVEVAIPNDLLEQGLVVVDTPGVGGIAAGQGDAALAFLPWADALIFVSDASNELSPAELEFLAKAMERCPVVLYGLTKTDIAPHWRRIVEVDRIRLAEVDCEPPILPLSADLRNLAFDRRDHDLNQQSGYPQLLATLDREVMSAAKARAIDSAGSETALVVDQLGAALRAELEVLSDPNRGAPIATQAADANARLEHLRGPGARWNTVVGDRISDLANDVTFGFRSALRASARGIEDEIEGLKSKKDWDDLSRRLQTEVAQAVTSAFEQIDGGAKAIARELVELLSADLDALPRLPSDSERADIVSLWRDKSIDPQTHRTSEALSGTVTGLRGAQSGIAMFGTMVRFLPAGAGAMLLATPVALGLGAGFASMQLFDLHQRKVAQRRQQARVNVRQFTDDVLFDVSNRISELLRDIQRSFRDDVGERIDELQRTYSEMARVAVDAARRDRESAEARSAQLTGLLARLGETGTV
jgi:hypothetical protein